MKVGILCHGRHVSAENWKLHEWGIPEKGLMGQIPKTILLVSMMAPEKIVFGTGASEKDGLKEAEYIIKYMMDNFDKLKEFPQFQNVSLDLLKDYISRHIVIDTNSMNTAQEIESAGKIFDQNGITRTIIVSNPDHISRCMQLAHQVYHDKHLNPLADVFGVQSDIGYDGTTKVHTVCVEMPHRGDDLSPDLSQRIGEYFKLPPETKKEFVKTVETFLDRHKK